MPFSFPPVWFGAHWRSMRWSSCWMRNGCWCSMMWAWCSMRWCWCSMRWCWCEPDGERGAGGEGNSTGANLLTQTLVHCLNLLLRDCLLEKLFRPCFLILLDYLPNFSNDSNGSPDLLLSTLLTMWKEEGIRRRLWENVCRKANWQ